MTSGKQRILAILLLLSASSIIYADPPPKELTVATWNLEWFFDEYTGDNFADLPKEQAAPNREEWEWKRNGVAEVIADLNPTILALQEVENQRVLYYLTKRLRDHHHMNYRIAFIQGADYHTEQDVGILYQSGLVEYSRREQTKEMWESKQYYNVSKHIFAIFRWGEGDQQEALQLVNVHLRAMPKAASIRERQARLVRHWVSDAGERGANVLVLGDFNTEATVTNTPKDGDLGILRGMHTTSEDDDLLDLHKFLSPTERGTHLLRGKQFDRILVSPNLVADDPGREDLVFQSVAVRKDLVIRGKSQDKDHWNIFYAIPRSERDLSDHYPVIAKFIWR